MTRVTADESALESALEYAENIIGTVREPLVVLDAELKILTVNDSFYRTFKVTPAETIGNFIFDLGNRQWDIPRLRVLLEEILPQNNICNDYEVDHVFQNIGHRTVLFNARQIFRKDLGSHIILLAMDDITDRKKTELSLNERIKELDCLYSIITLFNLPDIPLDALLTRTVMCIPLAWQFTEIVEARIELDGQLFQTARFQETPWMQVCDIIVDGTKIGQVSACYLEERPAGANGPFLREERHLLDAIAEKIGYLIENHRVEAKMHRLSRVVEQSPVIIEITDLHGTVEYVNPKFTEVTGYGADEVVGRNISLMSSDKTPPELHKKLWTTIASGKTWEGELLNKRKDGGVYWVHATIAPFYDGKGRITHYLAVKEDITEQKSTMAQLLHSQKQESIGQLAGGLAHDLNNILSVINGYATLAQLDMNKDTKLFNYLNEVITASSRAASLTSSLLAYSRKQEMNQHNQNLNALITTVGSFISRVIHDNIEFTLSLHDDPLVAYVDTVQIEQVLLNLATNARDAMPLGGTFTIATVAGDMDKTFIATHGYGKVGRYAIITVTDSGHGMDNQTKRKAFIPFFTTKEVGKGTGLGLSMVMGIIKQHGGFIDLQSEPGSGSVFRLYLPLTDTGAVAAAYAEENVPLDKGLGTILVAEDDPATLAVLEDFLKMAGYTVITAIDGQDAVEKFAARRGEIDLVIFDVIMPRKSGKAASDEIRGMSDTVKFIFVSGHSDHVIEREGYFDTDTEIVIKPILPFELLKKMRDILEN
jgi:PAS domain S-box-containing protein